MQDGALYFNTTVNVMRFYDLGNTLWVQFGGTAQAAAEAAQAAAELALDTFDDIFLGAKASDPTLDNDGNALATGAIYYNTAQNRLKVWSGSAWGNAVDPLGSDSRIPSPTASGFGQLIVQNDADDAYEFLGQGTANIQRLMSKGTNALPVFETEPYVFAMTFHGEPDGNIEIMRHTFERAVSFAEDFDDGNTPGSYGTAGTAPTAATRSFAVNKNGASYGDIEIATNGNVTFLTDGVGDPADFAAGDSIEIVSPSTIDDIADISFTFYGLFA